MSYTVAVHSIHECLVAKSSAALVPDHLRLIFAEGACKATVTIRALTRVYLTKSCWPNTPPVAGSVEGQEPPASTNPASLEVEEAGTLGLKASVLTSTDELLCWIIAKEVIRKFQTSQTNAVFIQLSNHSSLLSVFHIPWNCTTLCNWISCTVTQRH